MPSRPSIVASFIALLGSSGCVLPPQSAGKDVPHSTDRGSTTGLTTDPTTGDSVSATSAFVDTTSSSGLPATSSTGGPTCADAIECVVGCVEQIQEAEPEPDLTCFLDCEEGLTVEEALDLFQLTECVTAACIDAGVCESLEPTGSGSGSSSGSGSDSGSGSGGTTSGTGSDDPCLDCVTALLNEPGSACEEFAYDCD